MSRNARTFAACRALIEHFEFIALIAEPFDGAGEGIENFVVGFERIVESDDTPVASITLHVAQHIAAVEALTVVARHEVPHHHAILQAGRYIESGFHPAVGRSEEIGTEVGVGLLHVAHIAVDAMAQRADMVESMVSDAVSALLDHLINLGMLPYIVAHHEKGGFDAIMVQHIEHPRRHFRDRSIVEGEINGANVLVHPPESQRVEPSEPFGGLFDKHISGEIL